MNTNLATVRIKCNREHPCQNCVAYKDISSCKYEKRESGAEPIITLSKQSEQRPIQDVDSQSDHSKKSYGFAGEQNDTPYRGETHWSAVVKEVNRCQICDIWTELTVNSYLQTLVCYQMKLR
jgi:hypothetical protein